MTGGNDGHDGRGRERTRSVSTREALLEAALEAFTDHGYANASIAEIVASSGASVGSLYHHFGGKSGLYLTLWEDFQEGQESRAASAVTHAREAGAHDSSVPSSPTDPMALFVSGARAFLRGCWEERGVARLFLENDGPQGFDLLRRQRSRDWVRRNTKLLRVGDRRAEHVLVLTLTTVIAEAGREVAACEEKHQADEIIEEVCRLLTRLAGREAEEQAPGPPG